MFLKLKFWIILVALGQTRDRTEPLDEKWRVVCEKPPPLRL
jgi:hypothetical protein